MAIAHLHMYNTCNGYKCLNGLKQVEACFQAALKLATLTSSKRKVPRNVEILLDNTAIQLAICTIKINYTVVILSCQNQPRYKNWCEHLGVKSCEIKGGGQEMATNILRLIRKF